MIEEDSKAMGEPDAEETLVAERHHVDREDAQRPQTNLAEVDLSGCFPTIGHSENTQFVRRAKIVGEPLQNDDISVKSGVE